MILNPTKIYDEAVAAMDRGQWAESQALAERLLPIAPRIADLHYIAGVSALQMHQIRLALVRLRRAAELEPRRAEYLSQYARSLAIAGEYTHAMEVTISGLALANVDAGSIDTFGIVFSRAGAHDMAMEAFRRAVDLDPHNAAYRFNLGTSAMFHGDVGEAEAQFEKCVELDTGYWRAHLAISHLRRQTPTSNHLSRLNSLLSEFGGVPDARLHLNLAIAKECEDLEEFDRAFAHYGRGKSACRSRWPVSRVLEYIDRLTASFASVEAVPDGLDNSEAIFIVGMPRSGTTLVDRILSSHSQVHSAGELRVLGNVMQRMTARPASHLIEAATNLGAGFHDWRRLGIQYVNGTRPATGHTPRFTDKFPLNFLFVGHIALALPQAKVVCVRRHPLDTCLSNFRQLFSTDSVDFDYSFDLLDTGRYFIAFDRLMAHWHTLFPCRIIDVQYETLIMDPETCISRLLDACGLRWEETCLHFDRAGGYVATASALQVRSPLNRASMHRWRKYEKHLGDLRRLLEDAGIDAD